MWDVREPDEWAEDDEGGVKWMKVDVGDADAVEKAYRRVCDEVCRVSIPFRLSHVKSLMVFSFHRF